MVRVGFVRWNYDRVRVVMGSASFPFPLLARFWGIFASLYPCPLGEEQLRGRREGRSVGTHIWGRMYTIFFLVREGRRGRNPLSDEELREVGRNSDK